MYRQQYQPLVRFLHRTVWDVERAQDIAQEAFARAEELYQEQLAYFEAHSGRAAELLKTGDSPPPQGLPENELAATAVVVSALLSFDGCVIKR